MNSESSQTSIYLQTIILVASANPANRVFPIMDNEDLILIQNHHGWEHASS